MKKILRLLPVLLVAAVLLCAAKPQLRQAAERLLYPNAYEELVEREAQEFSLPSELVYAVMRTESKFRPEAESHAGAKGLMQLTDETFSWISELYPPEHGGEDIFNEQDNVHCGCALLRLLLDHFGDEQTALCAYNAGMGNVESWLSDERYSSDGTTLHTIPYPETDRYVKKVLSAREKYRELYGWG